MLEIKNIINNYDETIAKLKLRGIESAKTLIDKIVAHNQIRIEQQSKIEALQTKVNEISNKIHALFAQQNTVEIDKLKKQIVDHKSEIANINKSLSTTTNLIKEKLYHLPNTPHESVPKGLSDTDDEIVFQSEDYKGVSENFLPHWELIKKYNLIDFDLGNKVTGAGFPIYKGKGAKLQRALINFFIDSAVDAGYKEIQVPSIVNEHSAYGTGQLPDKEGMMYHINDTNYYLIPTAEVPITNIYRNTILKEKDLPIKHVGYTPCFRKEAGSWGSHVRGLNRLHQFDKVEIVQIQPPSKSYQALDDMCKHVENLILKLKLPYRKLKLCMGNLGFTSSLTYDIEVYSQGQKKWLEVSSISNFETFQSNRMQLRCKNNKNKKFLPHTLNGSAIALPRILASLIENNQCKDRINIPSVLIPYTGFDKIE